MRHRPEADPATTEALRASRDELRAAYRAVLFGASGRFGWIRRLGEREADIVMRITELDMRIQRVEHGDSWRWRVLELLQVRTMHLSKPLVLWMARGLRALEARKSRGMISAPPGQMLLRVAELIASPREYRALFVPLVSDMQYEYFDALSADRTWKARIACMRGYYAFGRLVGRKLPIVGTVLRLVTWLMETPVPGVRSKD